MAGRPTRSQQLAVGRSNAECGRRDGTGEEARDYLDHLIGGTTVLVDVYGPDRYKRILAVVFLGPTNVNVEMVELGLAERYRGAPCKAYCRDLRVAEVRARRNRVGMWAQGDKYESPAAFRRRMRLRGD